jgi:rRNA-processing protein FCF1
MTSKKFLNALANGNVDVIKEFLDILSKPNISYCVIRGLAVNAYAEPVVSMDLD